MNIKEIIKKISEDFPKKRILVVGDLMLDKYSTGNVNRISPEAPVPIVEIKNENFFPGGAGNVANNLSSLSASVTCCGVIGEDENGKILTNLFKEKKIKTDGVFTDKSRPTTLKNRIIAHHQQVVRVDYENKDKISAEINKRIENFITQNIKNFDGIIISDYAKGVISKKLVEKIVYLTKTIVTIDPKIEHFSFYKNVTSLTPNLTEAMEGMGWKKIEPFNFDLVKNLGKQIIKTLKSKSLLITLGESGMMLFENNKSYHIPTVAKEVFDVTGAGDTVISTFTLSLSCGFSNVLSAKIANIAAGIVVGKLGTATTTIDELIKNIKENKCLF